jgi:CheY-like chemotaxis protein
MRYFSIERQMERNLKILWVENHAEFARLATRQFLRGHTLTVVPSLAAARAVLAVSCFDVLLVDFDLDDGKGTELVRSLQESLRRVPIVATSSHEEGNRALLEAGADAACSKLAFVEIRNVIKRVIEEGRAD